MSDFLAKLMRAQAERRAHERDEFFASGDDIPDLDLMPPCSICGGGLEYDEGFYCVDCNVSWGRDGSNGTKEES